MTEVVIRFCVPCRYQPKAMQDADAILKEFGEALSGVRLVPGDRGIYDVEVDGDQADAILKEFGEALSGVRLVPGDRGIYDVEVDGDLVFSLDKAMRFPETPELIRKIRTRIAPRRTRRKR